VRLRHGKDCGAARGGEVAGSWFPTHALKARMNGAPRFVGVWVEVRFPMSQRRDMGHPAGII